MIQVQSILAATDFSADARHAVERAARLCATIGIAKGTVLHVLEASWLDTLKQFMNLPTHVEQGVIDDVSHTLDQLVDDIRHSTGFALEPLVRVGNPRDAILETAAGFDLLALGARGTHLLREFTVGTTAQRLLHKTQQPILVVKRKPTAAYQRMLVAVDFSPHSLKAFRYSRAIAPHATMYLMHVFKALFELKMMSAGVPDEIIEECRRAARDAANAEMTRFIEAAGVGSHRVLRCVEHGYAPAKLVERAHQWDADLMVVGKHGTSRIEQLLLGSVTQHLLAESQCDVLVVQ